MEYLDFENSVKHYLLHNGIKREIAEPVGFDAAKFVIKQDDKRYGRDVEFSPSDLTFNSNTDFRGLTHLFDQLILSYRNTGFESDWKYILEIENVEYILGQLDFKTAQTDEFTYFTTNIIQENKQAIIKSREDVNVNLFSDKDLDGNDIKPLETTLIYLQATPEKQESAWKMFEDYDLYRGSQTGGGTFPLDFMPINFITESEIENTLSPPTNSIGNLDDFAIIDAENELTNVTLKILGLDFKMQIADFINKFGYAYCTLDYGIGSDWATSDKVEIFRTGTMRKETHHTFQYIDKDFIIENLTIPRDQKLFLKFNFYLDTQNNPFTAQVWVTGGKIEVDAVSTSISSIIETFNLGDAMEYVIKSISGLGTELPKFRSGILKDQYITNGLLMRNINDQPFNLSLSRILSYLPELNGDYEVNENKVFFGLYDDFYKDVKIGNFIMPPNETFKTSFNDRYTINKYNFKYTKYENSKDESKSREGVHTEMETMLPNKMVDNSKDVQVGFIRDTFLIESTRKEAIKVKKDVATEQDDDVFIIDVVRKAEPIRVTEQFTVYHKADAPFRLKLLNDTSINWTLFGFTVGDWIKLEGINGIPGTPSRDGANFYIEEIEPDVLTLATILTWDNPFTGYGIVTLTYDITQTDLTNRTNEGFEYIEGTTTPKGFSNLMFTPKQNTLKYWSRYLATACLYHQNSLENIKVTKFIHNGELTTKQFAELSVREDRPIYVNELKEAILTPKLVETLVICDFSTFWGYRSKLRTLRGYIDVSDTNGNTISIFTKQFEYQWQDNLMTVIGEVKA